MLIGLSVLLLLFAAPALVPAHVPSDRRNGEISPEELAGVAGSEGEISD